MLKRSKLSTYLCANSKSLYKVSRFTYFSSESKGNGFDTESESETEWEKLLKPFDLEQLRKSLNKITPYQLNKLLELPLDVPTSMEVFQWAGKQKGYCHSFNVYYTLIDKLGAAGEFKIIDRLVLQMKEEGIVFRESLFIMIMKYYGYVTNGRLDESKAVLNESMSNIGCDPDVYTYNVLIRGLCKKGCMASAHEVVIESQM